MKKRRKKFMEKKEKKGKKKQNGIKSLYKGKQLFLFQPLPPVKPRATDENERMNEQKAILSRREKLVKSFQLVGIIIYYH